MGHGRNLMQPIAVEDVAHCFVAALEEPHAVGQTLDLCGDERFPFAQILDLILEASGRRRLKLRIPLLLARAQATLLEFIFPRLLKQPPPLNRDQLLMLQEDNVGDSEPAKRLFGFTPRRFRDGIAAWNGRA
jgi:NADH dehydrogenase